MLPIACTNYYEPEEIAETIADICAPHMPARGYTGDEYNGARRVQAIAEAVDALHDNTPPAVRAQLTHPETFEAVHAVLEWYNCHTENIAFTLAFGDGAAVFDALQTVHMMGQAYAIDAGAEHPRAL